MTEDELTELIERRVMKLKHQIQSALGNIIIYNLIATIIILILLIIYINMVS